MDRIFIILKIKLTPVAQLPCRGAIHMYMTIIVKFIDIYPRPQVSVYMTIGPLVLSK